MGDSSPSRGYDGLPSLAGIKRLVNGTGLLPAFDPISSSPGLPPMKRVARESGQTGKPLLPSFADELKHGDIYPTPVPTSETHILSSSPPARLTRRAPLTRTVSNLSQREPLASVPTAQLDISGEPMLFGRSGKSSHFQLHSVSKNISRVHLRAAFVPAEPPNPARVEIVCMGWNGMKVHCQGKHWDLQKEDSFTSESVGSDIMVDVADTRVNVQWPKLARKAYTPESSEDENETVEESPSRRASRAMQHRSPFNTTSARQYPISPIQENTPPLSDPPPIQIYEDHDSGEEGKVATVGELSESKSTEAAHPADSFLTQDFSDVDEENDPTVHSFGPMGANLIPQLASFCATSPDQPRHALGDLGTSTSSERKRKREQDVDEEESKPASPARLLDVSSHPIINHVVNQLAYSRLNQLPLSMVMNNLPTDLKEKEGIRLDYTELRKMIGAAPCIGEVRRVGKDASGAALESEYYYIPEKDFDDNRKEAVTAQLRKPGLRACRKSHKQYFWKKPK